MIIFGKYNCQPAWHERLGFEEPKLEALGTMLFSFNIFWAYMEKNLFRTTEGRILILGILLLASLFIGLIFCAIFDPDLAGVLAITALLNGLASRSAGVGMCIINGYGPIITISYNIYIEVITVCFTYSLFVLTTKNVVKAMFIRNLMARLEKKALEQKEKIQLYGWIGMFLFVMLPLPITGPVMGTIIGYMIKMPLVRNFTAAFTGSLTAIIIWFFCFNFLEQQFKAIQYIILAGIIIMVLSFKFKSIKDFFKSNE